MASIWPSGTMRGSRVTGPAVSRENSSASARAARRVGT